MSGGRIEVGVGAGWNDDDHAPLGLPFPTIEERADLLEDQLALLHGLWKEPDGWSFDGHQVTVTGGALPAAGRSSAPGGRRRERHDPAADPHRRRGYAARIPASPRAGPTSSTSARRRRRRRARSDAELDASCGAAGRDPATLTRSAMVGVLVGANADEVDRRAEAVTAGVRARRARHRRGSKAPEPLDRRHARRGARHGPALRRGRRRADHAPGLPAVGPRDDRPARPGARSARSEPARIDRLRSVRLRLDAARRFPPPGGMPGRRAGSGLGSRRGRGRGAP